MESTFFRDKCGPRKCDLCLTEKMIIARSDPKKLLNKQSELVSKYRHGNKFLLSNIRDVTSQLSRTLS